MLNLHALKGLLGLLVSAVGCALLTAVLFKSYCKVNVDINVACKSKALMCS